MSRIQMPGKAGEEEDESWSQTSITITPEEDAAIRTIAETTVISAGRDTPLVLGVNQIADRRTVQINTMRQDLFIDTAELEERISHSDAGCQTFLQGVPKVELPSMLKDEATQTMYLGNICPYTRHTFQDITRIMNDRIMPVVEKITEITQSIVTFEPDAPRNYIVDRLSNWITAEELQADNSSAEQTAAAGSTYVTDNLYFILERVLWLSDPDYCVPEVKMKTEVVQTFIKYDYGLGKVVLDADTQTSLTCEPRRSNTGLLTEWSANKEFAHNIIDECLEIGVYPRIIVHHMIDELVERCASQIHLPYRDKTVQTLAPCNALNDNDDEVLRKLRLEVVLDTLESSIIVLPLVGVLVEKTCMEIRQNATTVAAEILNRIEKNSVTIATRLAAIRQEVVSYKRPMDDVFEARKKRLRELLRNKIAMKLSSSTQTELAGVPDIVKAKIPRETVCSTCARHSECYICEGSFDREKVDPVNAKRNDIVQEKILRTQDILIAYNPCYVVATPSKIPKIQPLIARRRLPVAPIASKQPRPLSRADFRASASGSTLYEPGIQRKWLDDVCPPGPRSVKLKGKGGAAGSSMNDWSRVVQDASSVSGVWSIRGSSSVDSNRILRQVGPSSTCLSRQPPNRECAISRCDLSAESMRALHILKKTFIRNEESCSDCSYEHEKLDVGVAGQKGVIDSSADKEREETQDHQTSRGLGFNENSVRVVPIIHLQKELNKK